MKKHIIPLAFVALVVLGTLAFRLWPRTLATGQCDELYNRYAGSSDIHASFIKSKRINDTVDVDMTMLEALTDTGWAILQRDFNLPVIPEEYVPLFYGDSNRVVQKLIPKNDPSQLPDSVLLNNNLVAILFHRHTICVFEIKNMTQYNVIITENLNNNISNFN